MVSQRDGGRENCPGTAGMLKRDQREREKKKKENKESRKDGATTEG